MSTETKNPETNAIESRTLSDAVDRLVSEQDKVDESRGLCNTEERKLAMFDLIELRKNQMDKKEHIGVGYLQCVDSALCQFWECSLCKKETADWETPPKYCQNCGCKFVKLLKSNDNHDRLCD